MAVPINDEGAKALCQTDPSETSDRDCQPIVAGEPLGVHYIVGIGASAGGLEALENLFDHLPHDAGMSFVVIQHLSPDFKSMMDELLSRHTKLKIHRVEHGMSVEPDNVYLIPPKMEMIISAGRLLLTDKDPGLGLSLPIDTFFRSLAQDAGSRAIAVVLSGTGSDGSRGILEISKAGGLVIAQDEQSSKFDGMPKAAVETGVVDLVLTPQQAAAAIAEYRRTARIPQLEEPPSDGGFNTIFTLLRKEYGIDFSWYKSSTVSRRIERRLRLRQSTGLPEYAQRLAADRDELNQLYKDLLIGVTQFFRDPAAFDRLAADVIPPILQGLEDHEEARFWVAGCATGEEAYSLAILVHEQLALLQRPIEVKIFATDVHRSSLDLASAGYFTDASLAQMSAARRERYFTGVGDGYQICPDLRKMIVFAPQNVIKDAPFTRIDLVTCRNMLIYFQPIMQKKVMSLFHFALKPNGFLFLGPSEGPADLAAEFEAIDRHWKIFRKRRDVRLQSDLRLPSPPELQPAARRRAGRHAGRDSDRGFVVRGYEALAADYLPPGFVVDENARLLYTFPGGSDYLRQREGVPTDNLLDMVDRDLRVALAGAIQRAGRERVAVQFSNVTLRGPAQTVKADVHVKPFNADGSKYLLVSVAPRTQQPSSQESAQQKAPDSAEQRMQLLETELRHTKENLQATIEELETSNEELQATNEELVASNEELQSTNEELHSVNEELYTVNAEHQRKIDELSEVTEDLENLFRATDIGTIFLDDRFCIRKFTPNATRNFQIAPQDIGRRLDSFNHNLDSAGLYDTIREVASGKLGQFEGEVVNRFGTWYFIRVFQYESRQHAGGVVVSLVDISTLKHAQEQMNIAFDALNSSINAIILADANWTIRYVNPSFLSMFEFDSLEEILGKRLSDLFLRDDVRRLGEICTAGAAGQPETYEYTIVRRDGTSFHVEVAATMVSTPTGMPPRRMVSFVDITPRKQAEAARESYAAELELANETLRRAEIEARDAVAKRDQFLAILSHELRNPLSALMNAVRVLDRGGADADRNSQARKIIQRQSVQMSRLMNDLLDVARITQGKIKIEPEVFDAREIVDDAVESVRNNATAKQQQLVIHRHHSPVMIEADRSRLLQIADNLLVNATKYTPAGGRIEIRIKRSNTECLISVSDNGQGIPLDMLNTIFDMFVQDDASLDRADAGMGVGLTLVRSLTDLMGGKVEVASEGVGKGSCFTVRLPLTFRATAPSEVPHDCGPGDSSPPADTRILIVEDNADAREMLRTLLELDGYQVSVAEDGRLGLEAIINNKPDVALVDIGLPGLDGYEVARQATAAGAASTLLVALTGYGQADDIDRAFKAGFREHLIKPIDQRKLRSILAKTPTAPR